jgi:hypothetical protein
LQWAALTRSCGSGKHCEWDDCSWCGGSRSEAAHMGYLMNREIAPLCWGGGQLAP